MVNRKVHDQTSGLLWVCFKPLRCSAPEMAGVLIKISICFMKHDRLSRCSLGPDIITTVGSARVRRCAAAQWKRYVEGEASSAQVGCTTEICPRMQGPHPHSMLEHGHGECARFRTVVTVLKFWLLLHTCNCTCTYVERLSTSITLHVAGVFCAKACGRDFVTAYAWINYKDGLHTLIDGGDETEHAQLPCTSLVDAADH